MRRGTMFALLFLLVVATGCTADAADGVSGDLPARGAAGSGPTRRIILAGTRVEVPPPPPAPPPPAPPGPPEPPVFGRFRRPQFVTTDRCLATGCDPVELPDQSNLTFMEPMGDGWQRFMEADWKLGPTSEGYRCMTVTVPEDMYITAFAYVSPTGTHHSSFGVRSKARSDGVYPCSPGMAGTRSLLGAGAGAEPFELPPGVAMPLRAGEQVTMNLHLFNLEAQSLTGRSGLHVKTVPVSEVVNESSVIVAGPVQLNVPPGLSTRSGHCTLREDATLFSVGPHMHQSGVHMRIVAEQGDGTQILHDRPFSFYHQIHYPIEPLALQKGDRIRLECTYENRTDREISFGDSSRDEMCFAFLGLYPPMDHDGWPCSR